MNSRSRPLRVLHVLASAEPEAIAIADLVANIAAGLDQSRYEIHACFLGSGGPLEQHLRSSGARVLSANWTRGWKQPAGALRFLWQSARGKFDLVHLHAGGRSVHFLSAVVHQPKLIVHLHGCLPRDMPSRQVRNTLAGADSVVTASKAIASQVMNYRPTVLYAGVPVGDKRPPNHDPTRPLVIGTASRLVEGKGVEDLLEAFAVLATEFPNIRLEIAGSGIEQDRLKAKAIALGLSDKVAFLGWVREIRRAFRSWDIFASASKDEGFGLAAAQAMSEALPVVATRVGGLCEVVEHGRSGYLVPPGNLPELADRLGTLLRDADIRQTMGAAAAERIRSHFSIARMVARAEEIYEATLSNDGVHA